MKEGDGVAGRDARSLKELGKFGKGSGGLWGGPCLRVTGRGPWDDRESREREEKTKERLGLVLARATRCDAAHLRWCFIKGLRCLKIACDVLR